MTRCTMVPKVNSVAAAKLASAPAEGSCVTALGLDEPGSGMCVTSGFRSGDFEVRYHVLHMSTVLLRSCQMHVMSHLPEARGPEFSEKIHSRKPTSATGCGPACRRNRRLEATLGAAFPASATLMCTSPARSQLQASAAVYHASPALKGLSCGG